MYNLVTREEKYKLVSLENKSLLIICGLTRLDGVKMKKATGRVAMRHNKIDRSIKIVFLRDFDMWSVRGEADDQNNA